VGPRALGAQHRLHDPPRDAVCQPRGGLGVAPGLAGGLWGQPAVAHDRWARLREGGGGQGRRAGRGTPRGGAAGAARTPATTRAPGGPAVRRGLCALGLVRTRTSRRVGGRCPRPAAASRPAGAAHRQRASANTAGLSACRPRPAGAGPPATSRPPAALGASGGACGHRPAQGAAGSTPSRTGSHRGACGRGARRPAAHAVGTRRTGGAPLR
jgi:hypothetical protein